MRELPPPGLYGILDDRWVCADAFARVAEAYAKGGCRTLQFRMKGASDRDRLRVQREVVERLATLPGRFWVAVNDRADLAKCLAAEVPPNVSVILHVGQDDLPPAVARQIVGPDMVVGLSTHSETQVEEGCAEDVDYLGYGPVYPTVTKTNPDPVTGLEGLAHAIETSSVPIAAIGGVVCDAAPVLREVGARWVVVVSDLLKDPDTVTSHGLEALRARVHRLQEALT